MKKTLLGLFGLLLIASNAVAQNKPTERIYQNNEEPRRRYVGMQFDVGVPEGVMLGFDFHPYVNWARLNFSGGYNGMGPVLRGGLTLDPINFPMAPTLTVEGGHAFDGKFPGINDMPSVGYDFVNLHLGLEFGKRNVWRFFLHGGPTWAHVGMTGFKSIIDTGPLKFGDPAINLVAGPTAKLGFVVFF